jgi:hyperosmotically inducible periplasmic protein
MQATPPTTPPDHPPEAKGIKAMRSGEFRPRRVFWPGVLGAALIGAGVAAALVANHYDGRSLGERVDATVAAAESKVEGGVDDLRSAASGAAQGTAKVADRVAVSLGDAAITAAVKTALAADPSLSAININVTTTDGAVRLEGPAPDPKSRERAEIIAMAPGGVVAVDNRLVVAGGPAPGVPKPALARPAPTPTPTPTPTQAGANKPPVVLAAEAPQPVERADPAEPPAAPSSAASPVTSVPPAQ